MTIKDYVMIASVISNLKWPDCSECDSAQEYEIELIDDFCKVFKADNERFNEDKFRKGCR